MEHGRIKERTFIKKDPEGKPQLLQSIKGARPIIIFIGCLILVMVLEFPIARLILGSAKVHELLNSDEMIPEAAFNISVFILSVALTIIIELSIRTMERLKIRVFGKKEG